MTRSSTYRRANYSSALVSTHSCFSTISSSLLNREQSNNTLQGEPPANNVSFEWETLNLEQAPTLKSELIYNQTESISPWQEGCKTARDESSKTFDIYWVLCVFVFTTDCSLIFMRFWVCFYEITTVCICLQCPLTFLKMHQFCFFATRGRPETQLEHLWRNSAG